MRISPKIFLSYSWANTDIADKIDNDFKSIGITLTRDIRDSKYKDSLKEYMKRVRKVDFVIMLISDSFLKSQNCMYEVLELFKEKDFNTKLLQVFLPDVKVFDPINRLTYIKYWEGQNTYLKETAQGSNAKYLTGISEDFKILDNICNTIGDFLKLLSEYKGVTFSQLQSNNYGDILDFIGFGEEYLFKELFSIQEITDDSEKDLLIDDFIFRHPNYYLA